MNLFNIAIYPALKEDFFDLPFNINCNAKGYVGCTNVDRYFDIESAEREELVDIGEGVLVSRPVPVGRELRGVGRYFNASISHNGVVAIYSDCLSSKLERGTRDKSIIQFTDLLSTRQVEMEVESCTFPNLSESSLVGFFDNSMILLTYNQPLKEAPVESVFNNPTPDVFKRVGSADRVKPFTDVSLLHSTRVLYYCDTNYILHEYNVDTHTNTKIDVGRDVLSFASMTGIDVGVKTIFQGIGGDYRTFTLNRDNTTTKIEGKQIRGLNTFLPSSTCPSDIKKGMLKYFDYFIFNKKKITPTSPIKFEEYHSLVRIYKDVFLDYDKNTKQWVLIRIVIP